MNIFVLDESPVKAAEYHCNKHVVKMILEAGQMLCAAHWMSWLDHYGKSRKDFKLMRDVKKFLADEVPKEKQPPWGLTHVNHPCTIWTRESAENYFWHLELMNCLLIEYTSRYQKHHKSEPVCHWLGENVPVNFPKKGRTPFAICMNEDYKVKDNVTNEYDVVESYRNYYNIDKVRFAKWEPRSKAPSWFIKGV